MKKNQKIKPQKKLVFFTLIIMVIIAIAVPCLDKKKQSPKVFIETTNQPSIGNREAKVHLVVFEEPKCPFCKEFSLTIFPKIKSEYIDKGKVLYTLVMVSFLPNSMPGAIASYSVYNGPTHDSHSHLFFAFVEEMYKNQKDETLDWLKPALLLEIAKKVSPTIDLHLLESDITNETYRSEIEKNTQYGRKLMGGSIVTPSVFVNGIEVQNLTYHEISKLIEEQLKGGK